MNKEFYHEAVLLKETIEGLSIKKDGIYVDATMGGFGHSGEILKHLNEQGKLIAFDLDLDAVKNIPNDSRITFIHSNFKFIKSMLRVEGIVKVDGICGDFGVSSYQFDAAHRGFSYRFDSQLDMRMNQMQELTAAKIINQYREEDLIKIFSNYGEVRNSLTLTKHIVSARKLRKILTINEFLTCIETKIMGNRQKYLSQVFQALRIEVNDELNAITKFLQDALDVLKPGGTMAIITFHSLEDRVVKNFFKNGKVNGESQKNEFGKKDSPFEWILKKPIEPGTLEIAKNKRARSAKLRLARKNE